MIDIVINPNIKDLNNLLRNLSPLEIKKAANAGINRGIAAGRVEVRKAIRQKYNIPFKRVSNPYLVIKRSNISTLTATLSISKTPISLANFNPVFNFKTGSISISNRGKQFKRKINTRRSAGKGDGVTVSIIKGQKQNIPFAFLLKNKGVNAVFARGNYGRDGGGYSFIKRNKRINKTGDDLPISSMLTVSLYGAFKDAQVNSAVDARVRQVYMSSMVGYITNVIKK